MLIIQISSFFLSFATDNIIAALHNDDIRGVVGDITDIPRRLFKWLEHYKPTCKIITVIPPMLVIWRVYTMAYANRRSK